MQQNKTFKLGCKISQTDTFEELALILFPVIIHFHLPANKIHIISFQFHLTPQNICIYFVLLKKYTKYIVIQQVLIHVQFWIL